jgi:NADH:ubiquinone reductase (non-electrogenic)
MLLKRTTDTAKKQLVILGSGFAAMLLLKKIDLERYATTVVSPRNHFLFTPLLASTTVGTVEFRSIIDPIRKARKGDYFVQGTCVSLDVDARRVHCASDHEGSGFELEYDTLVIAVGAWNNTFGIPGVAEHAMFLKEASDARRIRERIVDCLERADVPGIDPEEQKRLLNFVVVGGGPTGIEFAAELHDLFEEDLPKSYPDLVGRTRITLYEAAGTILNSFDEELREYTMKHFRRQGIEIRLESAVQEVGDGYLKLKSGETVHTGLIVWSTGYGPTGFTQALPFAKERGRIVTDGFLRIPDHPEIYAMGDCAIIAGTTMPQTAQVAMQAGKYLAGALNGHARGRQPEPFKFNNMGMLAYIGESRALADIPKAKVHAHGWGTYYFWRSAYFTRLVSFKNKVLVLFDWLKTWVFGRDLSKF